MTPARCIEKQMNFFVTVRAVNRSARFVPTCAVIKVIRYCLAVTLQKYRGKGKLQLFEFLFMSNHFHLLGVDLDESLPDFVRELNSLISRELNALRGISGANIEKGYNLVKVVTDQRLIDHAVYTLANPCRANLVKRCKDWRSVSSLSMRYGEAVVVEKPTLGLWAGKVQHASRRGSKRSKRAQYAGRSKLPETAELVIDRPPVMMELSDDELRQHILDRLDAKEREYIEDRKRRGVGVLGWNKVVKQHYLAIPNTKEELFTRVPSFSASHVWERVVLAAKRKEFLKRYYAAQKKFVDGIRDVVFPYGTWLMRVRYRAACEPCVSV